MLKPFYTCLMLYNIWVKLFWLLDRGSALWCCSASLTLLSSDSRKLCWRRPRCSSATPPLLLLLLPRLHNSDVRSLRRTSSLSHTVYEECKCLVRLPLLQLWADLFSWMSASLITFLWEHKTITGLYSWGISYYNNATCYEWLAHSLFDINI